MGVAAVTLTAWEVAARHFEPDAPRRWRSPGDLAKYLDPRTVQTPALDLIDAELVRMADEPDQDHRVIITMAPQEGKSQRVATVTPTWWLCQRPDDRIAVASYGQTLATRNGRSIRRLVTEHPELGLRVAADNGAAHEWEIEGHDGGVLAVGIGGGFSGRPVDLLVIDDPIKDRKEADSEVYRQAVWDWWTDVASARFGPVTRVVLILTRWHDDDLAGRLLAAEDGHLWRVVNIPAQSDHDPAKGEVDILGREPGEFMISARGRTQAQWERRKITAGPRTWAALYQGRPSPATGNTFKRDLWKRYDEPLWAVREDGSRVVPDAGAADLLMSWDMAFKDLDSSDYVVGQVWLRRGADAYLLDQIRGRWDFPETCRQFKMLVARWPQVVLKVVEDKANGPAVIASLRHQIPGIVPEEPDGSKPARAAAITPLQYAGNLWLPASALAPWADELIEEAAAFPKGKHDDQVDAMSQGVKRLILDPLIYIDDTDDDEDVMPRLGWAAAL